jgi:hypothetical protein
MSSLGNPHFAMKKKLLIVSMVVLLLIVGTVTWFIRSMGQPFIVPEWSGLERICAAR